MLSAIPVLLEKMNKKDLEKEILRTAIIAEFDAINLYEQMAGMTEDPKLKRLLLDVAREEKTHVGEFQALLLLEDREQSQELEAGRKEVQELIDRERRKGALK